MENQPHIRIFPHNRDEFPTIDTLTTWLLTGLKARGGHYHMRSGRAVKSLSTGSIVLFRYNDKIVGEGVITGYSRSTDGQAVDNDEPLYASMAKFAPTSIRIYSPPVSVTDLQAIIGDEPNIVPSAQPYFIIKDWAVYPKLIAFVTARGQFM
ncbi:hypothetical protein J2T55_000194 [Methylohalomonas lacus]|uniref:EVE domain-containing protein n=1 Tax=Methylohalomonas lacus TaxID=398773 RepID=A0AAE3L4T3_9GAMM|nr:hypothetical protein [Methylohalomonas lacus]MCS3902202.1 hypothetical protein [Methylohalomonas lacus]